MRVLPSQTIPIFLRGSLPSGIGSQLRYFDVFYKQPPVVGWHVVGADEVECAVTGFTVIGEDLTPSGVTGFIASDERKDTVLGFTAEQLEQDIQGAVGFSVYEESELAEGVTGFSVMGEQPSDYVAGFTVEDE